MLRLLDLSLWDRLCLAHAHGLDPDLGLLEVAARRIHWRINISTEDSVPEQCLHGRQGQNDLLDAPSVEWADHASGVVQTRDCPGVLE